MAERSGEEAAGPSSNLCHGPVLPGRDQEETKRKTILVMHYYHYLTEKVHLYSFD